MTERVGVHPQLAKPAVGGAGCGGLRDEFSIHDGLIVASHRAQETDAILTTDGVVRDAGYETVWT